MDGVQANSGRVPIPWQERDKQGFFGALFGTIKRAVFKPGEFFEALEIKPGWGEPLIFFTIINAVTEVVSFVWQVLLPFGNQPAGYQTLLMIVLLPAFLFISAGIIHSGVMLLGGRGGFNATYHVLAYTAAGSVFAMIPVLGGIIAVVWCFVLGVTGLKKVHGLTTVRALFAYGGLVILAILAILVAIAIPDLLRAKASANEALAQSSLKAFSSSAEYFVTMHEGQYPLQETDLKTASLELPLNGRIVAGYKYSVQLQASGYEVSAAPVTCGTTGMNIFHLKSGLGGVVKMPCQASEQGRVSK